MMITIIAWEEGTFAPYYTNFDDVIIGRGLRLTASTCLRSGGVEGVKKLLEGGGGDPASPQISEKTRKTLNKIVGETNRQEGNSRPQ